MEALLKVCAIIGILILAIIWLIASAVGMILEGKRH